MKPVRILCLCLPLLLLACNKESGSGEFSFDQELNLRAGRSYTAGGDNLSIKVTQINDSRCPIGVVCVWQGEATVRLDVSDGNLFRLTLSTLRQPADTIGPYIFRLIDVLPYPVHGREVPDAEKTVILEVRKTAP